jgi:DNA-binding transcriptional LysR family regulator
MREITPNLGNVDLRLLRVFEKVIQYNGFSAAQDQLGLTQATISNHMTQLEERLGMRLCERGRSGFFLTEQGRLVHSAMLDLFGAIHSFQSIVGSAKGGLVGTLDFGTVDAMYTNPDFNLATVLGDFARLAPDVTVNIDIASPQDLSRGLLSGRYHVILTPEQGHTKAMNSTRVLEEQQVLCCGAAHPLFDTSDKAITAAMLAVYPFASRSYMLEEEVIGTQIKSRAVTAHMESAALLIESGNYLGFLPGHFAERWIRRGLMRSLAPATFGFMDTFHVVHRRKEKNPAATTFVNCINRYAMQ